MAAPRDLRRATEAAGKELVRLPIYPRFVQAAGALAGAASARIRPRSLRRRGLRARAGWIAAAQAPPEAVLAEAGITAGR